MFSNVLIPTDLGDRAEEKRKFLRLERWDGEFSRSIILPCAVRDERSKAEYKDGTLSVKLRKKVDQPKSVKIKVKRNKNSD